MAIHTAPRIPFHPAFCPRCRYHAATIERCRAYVTDSTPRPLLGVFSGESNESCERFALLQTVPEAPAVSEASEVNKTAAASEATPTASVQAVSNTAASAPPSSAPSPEARIHCPKCSHENPPHLMRCSVCTADLLPGESLGFRLATFVVCLLAAGFFGWLSYGIANQTIHLPESLNDPIKAGFIALVLPVAGLVMLFRRTPRFTRYANRAERHVSLNLRQAAMDYTHALEHAPEKEQAGLLRKRAAIYEKLGQMEDATRDLIAVTYAEGAYQTGASLARLMGADPDVYASGRAKDERSRLLESGRAVVIGYCPACKDAVELTSKLTCATHPRAKPKRVRMVVPGDAADARKEILAGKKRRSPISWRIRVRRLAYVTGALIVAYLVFNAYKDRQPPPSEPAPAAQPAIVVETMAPAVQTATFSEQGVSFEYPSNWELITESEERVLLNSSLKGIGEYDYIGGVFINGADSCKDCAQMTLVVIPMPGVTEAISAEQYAGIKARAEQSMGERLLEHQFTRVDGIPAASSKYIGASRNNQLWDVMLILPGTEQAIMFSCSAQPDAYAGFEPVFDRAMESLSFGFSPGAEPPDSSETATAQPDAFTLAQVKGNSINVRAGPGTTYAIVGRLTSNSEIQVAGRNEAGDWLNIVDPPGWVSADLVRLSGPLDSLPVKPSPP